LVALATQLLRHACADHREGLKVFYVQVDGIPYAACPSADADPRAALPHGALAEDLSTHSHATRRAYYVLTSTNANQTGRSASTHLQQFLPEQYGGTRLVAHGAPSDASRIARLTLEPSVQYGYRCADGTMFERLAAFHANVLRLLGVTAPLWPTDLQLGALAARIDALRAAP
jgi:hypothetical protein